MEEEICDLCGDTGVDEEGGVCLCVRERKVDKDGDNWDISNDR